MRRQVPVKSFSSCLAEGALLFGWSARRRDVTPAAQYAVGAVMAVRQRCDSAQEALEFLPPLEISLPNC